MMQRKFNSELSDVKQQYESSIKLVSEASKNLGGLFKSKMIKIKSRLTKILAEVDLKTEASLKEVNEMSKLL